MSVCVDFYIFQILYQLSLDHFEKPFSTSLFVFVFCTRPYSRQCHELYIYLIAKWFFKTPFFFFLAFSPITALDNIVLFVEKVDLLEFCEFFDSQCRTYGARKIFIKKIKLTRDICGNSSKRNFSC